MSKTITISPGVTVPMELTTRRSAIFGISGSGKSNSATLIIEQLLKAGEQIVLIDPKGEGWGLQSSADGKSAGYNIIVFGQPRGDIEDLREQHADQIADFVVDSGRSVVLSLLGFDSDQSERRFVTKFFQRLYRRKSQQPVKTRTLVVLEEAHLFVPEQAAGANAEMVGAIKRIARQGRSAGIGLMIVDQRPQDVAKSIISQTEFLICHQLVHKLDRAALMDWVKAYDNEGQGETFLASLASLQSGEGWIWSPAWLKLFERAKIDRRTTYDSGATPDGSTAAAPKAKASVDLDSLRKHLSKVVEEAKANDPKELKKALADANKKITDLEKIKPAPAPKVETKTVEKFVLKDGQLARAETLVGQLQGAFDKAVERLSGIYKPAMDAVEVVREAIKKAGQPQFIPVASRSMSPISVSRKPASPIRTPIITVRANGESFSLPTGERKILIACAQYDGGVERSELTVLTGFKRSTRDAYIKRLREKELVDVQGEMIISTEVGVAALGNFEPLPTGDALREYWMLKLPAGESALLDQLAKVYPAYIERESLDELTGFKRSTRDAYLKRMFSKRLTEIRGTTIKASDTLFDRASRRDEEIGD